MLRKIGILASASLLVASGFLAASPSVEAASSTPAAAAAAYLNGMTVSPPPSATPPTTGISEKVTGSPAKAKLGSVSKREPGTSVAPSPSGGVTTNATGSTPVFYYVSGSQSFTSGYPTLLTGLTKSWNTYLDADDYHTLLEFAAIKTISSKRNIVEIGLHTDPSVEGDSNTHLWGFWWKNGVGEGYNTGTGFVPYVTTPAVPLTLGMTIPLHARVQLGIQINATGDWWLYGNVNDDISNGTTFDGTTYWIGYYPASLWNTTNTYGAAVTGFTNMDNAQAFGEVAAGNVDGSGNPFPPCTDMGGIMPDQWASSSDTAYMSSITYNSDIALPSMTWGVHNPSVMPSYAGYGLYNISARSAYIGGEGADSSGNYPGHAGWC